MLECHHKQFITITLAYHVKSSTSAQQGEHHRQAAMSLWNEMDSFSSSFRNWVTAHQSYMEALNAWLQKCVLQPSPSGCLPTNIHLMQRLAHPDGVTPCR